MSVNRYHYARDVEEVLSLLEAYADRGAIIAGGVDLARGLASKIEGLIDITTAGLGGISADKGGLIVGATTTLEEIRRSQEVRRYLSGFLVEVMDHVATLPLRNMATLGGAVVSAHSWADIPTALIALGAEVHWRTEEKAEKAPLEELYQRPFRLIFRRGVLTQVVLPHWEGAFAFEKVSRNAGDIALINCACGLGIEGGRIAWARVAVGATPYRAARLPGVEELLIGEVPSGELWVQAARAAGEEARVGDDMRASAEWRRAVVPIIVRRALERAASKMSG